MKKISIRKPKTDFILRDWYSSDEAKRSFGAICQAVNEQGREVELLGSEDRPYLVLISEELVPTDKHEVSLSIDEIKADWSAVTSAAMFFGTSFRIRGKRIPRAVLRRHRLNENPALKYRRPQFDDLPQAMEHLLEELRKTTDHLNDTSDIMKRRFQEAWRDKNL